MLHDHGDAAQPSMGGGVVCSRIFFTAWTLALNADLDILWATKQ